VFLIVLFAFFFAFLGAFRIFAATIFLELTDFDLQFVAFDTDGDGQFGGASFDFGRGVQDLVGVTGSQGSIDDVAFLLTFQIWLFAAFAFDFVIIAIGFTLQAGEKTIAIATGFRILDFASFFEGEFFAAFAFAAALGR